MGKNKTKERKDGEETSLHSAATVCVSGLPYSFTNAQLEEAFSDVGPVRLCFMVTNKAHQGLIIFSLFSFANRAIELKNGSTVGGRRITVKQATHRPSLKERRKKAAQGGISSLPDSTQAESDNKDSLIPETDKQGISLPRFVSCFGPFARFNISVLASVPPPEEKIEKKPIERKKPTKLHVDLADKETCSDKQRVARTVIFGGLVNADMAEAVHSRVKEIGTVCSVRYPLPKEELQQNGLTQDGCRTEASAVLFKCQICLCCCCNTTSNRDKGKSRLGASARWGGVKGSEVETDYPKSSF
uniref:RRM domain-containing protein n=1 Tax=Brassica oleracea TaxID=3712 RepID=A0A3P6C1U3_BRAOL|nr:unnamed protein product [Brassica oleracea]